MHICDLNVDEPPESDRVRLDYAGYHMIGTLKAKVVVLQSLHVEVEDQIIFEL